MFKFYNAHPEGKRVGDCVKRAICTAAEIDYHEVQLELNRYKKITGCAKYNDNKNYKQFIEKVLCGIKISFPAVAGEDRMNGERFCEEYPKGKYILRMAGHLTACVDGKIYDTWDCTDKCVYNAWLIPNKAEREKFTAEAETKAKTEQANKEKQKLAVKKIKDKYAKKLKPLQQKIKELEKQMAKELKAVKEVV